MAHNLATINGRIAMAYAGETPWHRLGVRMGDRADVQTALAAAALDWTVDAQPLYLADGREVDRRAIVRDLDAAILGTVGPAYVPMQNADAFGILTDACAESGVTTRRRVGTGPTPDVTRRWTSADDLAARRRAAALKAWDTMRARQEATRCAATA